MVALAVAMGIGRFAFTPLLPLMQTDSGVSLIEGGWLASANYLGYLIGALLAGYAFREPLQLLKTGLALVVITTFMMVWRLGFVGWGIARLVAGLASAWVLIGTTVLCLGRLAVLGRGQLSGLVFSGVGAGIFLVGLVCHGVSMFRGHAVFAWGILAALALVGGGVAWRGLVRQVRLYPLSVTEVPEAGDLERPGKRGMILRQWRLIMSYGLFGIGYILPATFLPAQARIVITDSNLYGWIWPIFGVAASISTIISGRLVLSYSLRTLWTGAQWVMIVGLLAPVLWPNGSGLILAALCVGGTFMVITTMGLQEARMVGGALAQVLVASMTAAFAVGQLLGPLLMNLLSMFSVSMDVSLILAAMGLFASNMLLYFSAKQTDSAQEEER